MAEENPHHTHAEAHHEHQDHQHAHQHQNRRGISKYYAHIALIVIIIGAALALVYSNGSKSANTSVLQQKGQAVPQQQLAEMYRIANNQSLADAVSVGTVNLPPNQVVHQSILTSGGKPEVVYVGGDFCPYCAVTRWGLVLALMRFGNFTSLHYMVSNASDVYPTTATFTFENSSYSSGTVSFSATEVYNFAEQQVRNATPLEIGLMNSYNSKGSIPFIDFGNVSVQMGAPASPGSNPNAPGLGGKDWAGIIATLNDTGSPITQAIIGEANVFTAQICEMINNSSSVCSQRYVRASLA
ncbi:MAG: DUF929 family protein [Candidatus Micrarchaeota archaeon]|nr:DUF929 family protein [Candidatus Micrarchaeota archaeon]